MDADTGIIGGGAVESASDSSVETTVFGLNDFKPRSFGEFKAPEPAVSTEPAAEGQIGDNAAPVVVEEPKEEVLLAGKFKSKEALETGYKNLESLQTQKNQEAAQIKAENLRIAEELENYKNLVSKFTMTPQTPEQAPVKPEEMTPEQMEEMKEQMIDKFMNDPLGYEKELEEKLMNKLLDKVEGKIKPVADYVANETGQASWNNAVSQFENAVDDSGNPLRPDFNDLKADMSEYYKQHPELSEDVSSLEDVYFKVKGMKAGVLSTPKTPEEMLNDPEFVKAVLANQTIKETIVKSHLEGIRGGQPPPVINSSLGGQPSASPNNKPKSFAEASKRALERITGIISPN